MAGDSMRERLQRLVQGRRWAALATVDASGMPAASMVGYVTGDAVTCVYLHLSALAAHTANLLSTGRAALVISEDDSGAGDPQELTRVTLQGSVTVIDRTSEEYCLARNRYLARLPAAQRLFEFADFKLFRLDVEAARFVGGFAQARSFTPAELQ